MRVLHVLASGSINWGGPPAAVFALANGLRKMGIAGSVVTLDEKPYPRFPIPDAVEVYFCGHALIASLGIPANAQLLRTLRREVALADVVHLHELWHMPQVLGSLISKAGRKPYVISPHGAMEPFYLVKPKLKLLAWHMYQRRVLKGASVVHAINPREEELLSALVGDLRIEVIPNGIDVSRVDLHLRQTRERIVGQRPPSSPFVIFLGRLAPKKGLQTLLEAFSRLVLDFPRLHLVIAGPDPFGLAPALQTQASKSGFGNRLTYLGIVTEPFKYALLAAAEALVLPSESEGFSMSVLEALACRTPVVVSEGCHLPI